MLTYKINLLANLIEGLSNEAVNAAIVGAVIGAVFSHVIGAIIAAHRDRKRRQEEHLARVSGISHHFLAEIYQFLITRNDAAGDSPARSVAPKLTRLEGDLMKMQLEIFSSYSSRKVRAATVKLVSRLSKLHAYSLEEPYPNLAQTRKATHWAMSQAKELMDLMAKDAGIALISKSGFAFVGFRKVSDEDMRQLSFEDSPPPWEFAIHYPALAPNVSDDDQEAHLAFFSKQFANLRCPIHDWMPQIQITGDPSDAEVAFEVMCCCSEQQSQIEERRLRSKGLLNALKQ